MDQWVNLLRAVIHVDSNISDLVIAAAMSNEVLIINLNDNQLEAGIKSDGSKIVPPYTKYTKRIKRQKGQPTNRVNLYDEGDFRGQMIAIDEGQEISITSMDWKTKKLSAKSRYGEDIFGLTDDSKDLLADASKESMITLIRQKLGI